MFGIISFTSKLSRFQYWLITLGLFALITLPRFNRNTILVNRPLNDARYFIAYVEYFRGEVPSDVIRPASNWRILVPATASLLPFEPMTALNMVNLVCLLASVVFLFESMRVLQINEALCRIGCWMFIVSFPTFYYTCIGYVDPGAMLFISMGIYVTLRNNLRGLVTALILGATAKETIVLIVPFVLGFYWPLHKQKALLLSFGLLVLLLAENIAIRQLVYLTPGERNPAFWSFSTEAISLNIHRLNSYLAPLLSFGIPGLVLIGAIYKTGWRNVWQTPILLGSVCMTLAAIGLFGVSVIATYGDGRMIWPATYAMVIAGMFVLNKRVQA